MPPPPDPVITVSPPNLDRTGFLTLEQDLDGGDGPLNRDWVLDRFHEGFQIRMLRPPLRGYVEFAPGRASWRPLIGVQRMVVVQALKVSGQDQWDIGAVRLLASAEHWARYYDFDALLLPLCATASRVARTLRQQGYALVDRAGLDGGQTVDLWAKIFHGPVALPRLPRDWTTRARRLGPGLVVQSVGHCSRRLACGYRLVDRAQAQGVPARLDALHTADDARARLVTPCGFFAVALDGQLIDDGQMTEAEIWQEVHCRKGL